MKPRYPETIPSIPGRICRCGREKSRGARICFACDPVFQSYRKAIEWAAHVGAGECVLAYRNYGIMRAVYKPCSERAAA